MVSKEYKKIIIINIIVKPLNRSLHLESKIIQLIGLYFYKVSANKIYSGIL